MSIGFVGPSWIPYLKERDMHLKIGRGHTKTMLAYSRSHPAENSITMLAMQVSILWIFAGTGY